MSNEVIGRVCFKRGTGDVAHKFGGDAVVYKTESLQFGKALISISWPSDNRDLDIMGFWTGNEAGAVGWSHASQSDPPYWAQHGGDNTSAGGTETIEIMLTDNYGNPNWAFHGRREYQVHFNYYGEVNGSATCTVTITQGGKTRTLSCGCSTNKSQRATASDPGVYFRFNDIGELVD